MTRAFEDWRGRVLVDGSGDTAIPQLVAVGERIRRLLRGVDRAGPVGAGLTRVEDGELPDRAALLHHPPAFTGALTVRDDGRRQVRRRAGKIDGNLALQILPGKIVVPDLGHVQAVADKHERCIGSAAGATAVQRDRPGEVERRGLPAADDGDARRLRIDGHGTQRYRLQVTAVASAGLQSELLEVRRHVLGRLAMSLGTSSPSQQRVVRQPGDVRPPLGGGFLCLYVRSGD